MARAGRRGLSNEGVARDEVVQGHGLPLQARQVTLPSEGAADPRCGSKRRRDTGTGQEEGPSRLGPDGKAHADAGGGGVSPLDPMEAAIDRLMAAVMTPGQDTLPVADALGALGLASESEDASSARTGLDRLVRRSAALPAPLLQGLASRVLQSAGPARLVQALDLTDASPADRAARVRFALAGASGDNVAGLCAALAETLVAANAPVPCTAVLDIVLCAGVLQDDMAAKAVHGFCAGQAGSQRFVQRAWARVLTAAPDMTPAHFGQCVKGLASALRDAPAADGAGSGLRPAWLISQLLSLARRLGMLHVSAGFAGVFECVELEAGLRCFRDVPVQGRERAWAMAGVLRQALPPRSASDGKHARPHAQVVALLAMTPSGLAMDFLQAFTGTADDRLARQHYFDAVVRCGVHLSLHGFSRCLERLKDCCEDAAEVSWFRKRLVERSGELIIDYREAAADVLAPPFRSAGPGPAWSDGDAPASPASTLTEEAELT